MTLHKNDREHRAFSVHLVLLTYRFKIAVRVKQWMSMIGARRQSITLTSEPHAVKVRVKGVPTRGMVIIDFVLAAVGANEQDIGQLIRTLGTSPKFDKDGKIKLGKDGKPLYNTNIFRPTGTILDMHEVFDIATPVPADDAPATARERRKLEQRDVDGFFSAGKDVL